MGRIRTNYIKGMCKQLVAAYPGKFGKDFDKNKAVLAELRAIDEKFTRNKVAGYICKVVMKKKF